MKKATKKNWNPFKRKQGQDWRLVPVKGALEIIMLYIALGIVWIFLSDYALSLFISVPRLVEDLQLAKGIFYVLLTALLFYWIIKRRMDLYLDSIFKLQKTNADLNRSNEHLTQLEKQLYHLAYFDQLTNLPNRNRLEEVIQLYISQNPNESLRVVYLDIDNFRLINEVKGFAAGDQLLEKIAQEMEELVKPPHQVFRYGGNQFVFLLRGIAEKDVFMRLIENYTRETKRSLMLGSDEYFYSLSSGVSSYPEDGLNYDELMQHAEMALQMAKVKGPGNIVVYEPGFAKALSENIDLTNMLQTALLNKEINVNYQPIYDVKQERLIALETLIRWKQAKRGFIAPMEFIPIAEKSGQINELTRFVIDKAFAYKKQLESDGLTEIEITINFSSKLLVIENMFDYLKQMIVRHQINPSHIVFEITESILLENFQLAIITLTKLRKLGFKISMDDFGTGYSSLAYLQQLPMDILKIDRSFIMRITAISDKFPLVKFMIDLGHTLGLRVVAEGVETTHQKEVLINLGVDEIQGYLYSKPLSEDDAKAFINGHRDQHLLP